MEDTKSLLNQISNDSLVNFFKDLELFGFKPHNEYRLQLFDGDPYEAQYSLMLKTGLFSTTSIFISDSRPEIEAIQTYIRDPPGYKDLKLQSGNYRVEHGYYALVHASYMKTNGADKDLVNSFIQKWQTIEPNVEYLMNETEELLCGFIPETDERKARIFSEIINSLAFMPASDEEIRQMKELVASHIKKLTT